MVIKFLNKNLGFIHTDCKTLNIFIDKNNRYVKKYRLLKDEGFIINYIPLVADLDNSVRFFLFPLYFLLCSTGRKGTGDHCIFFFCCRGEELLTIVFLFLVFFIVFLAVDLKFFEKV